MIITPLCETKMASETAPEPQKNAMKNREFKEKFDAQLGNYYKEQSGIKKPWTRARVAEVIRHIQAGTEAASASGSGRRTSAQYYWSNKYEVARAPLVAGTGDRLILKRKAPGDPTIQVIPIEQFFDLLFDIHEEIGHAARDKMVFTIKNKFYIPRKAVEIFVSLCPTCHEKRLPKKSIPKPVSPKPGRRRDFNSRGQLDLIDLRSAPDGAFKWLLMYQDYGTKFIHLRPLQTNRPSEVALELLKIFLTFGPPFTLQSKNASKFTTEVIEEVMKLWPECGTVNGGSRHPQTKGSVACSVRDVAGTLHAWMRDNNSTNWSLGCHFVQCQKNAALHKSIQKSPYNALFGCDPSGLQVSHISENILQSVNNEEDLERVSHGVNETGLEQHKFSSDTPDTAHFDQFNIKVEIDSFTSNDVDIKEEAQSPESTGEWSEQEQSPSECEPEPRDGDTGLEPRAVKTDPEPGAVKSEPQLWAVKVEPGLIQQPQVLEHFHNHAEDQADTAHVKEEGEGEERRGGSSSASSCWRSSWSCTGPEETRAHTGEKPYSCETCHQSFSNPQDARAM